MAARVFTDQERETAQYNRREARHRRIAEASTTVDKLLAEAAGAVPARTLAHAEKARKGRVASLVALKCGDYSNWQKAEIAGCTVTNCPLYPLHPYGD